LSQKSFQNIVKMRIGGIEALLIVVRDDNDRPDASDKANTCCMLEVALKEKVLRLRSIAFNLRKQRNRISFKSFEDICKVGLHWRFNK